MKYALRWKTDGSEGIAWDIRGIKPDASFYGELRFDSSDPSKRKIAFLEGQIPKSDWPRIQELLQGFETPVSDSSARPCFALIAKWEGTDLGKAQITFRYNQGDESKSEQAKRFVELHHLLEKEVSKTYERIT